MPAAHENRGWLKRTARFWQRSYAPDYLGLSLIIALYIPIVLLLEPFHRMFSLDDRSKAYPHALVERVSSLQNILVAGVFPFILLCLWLLIHQPGLHKSQVTILGYLTSLFMTLFLTDIIKNAVGRPRPDLLDRCRPRAGTPEHELVTIDVCTQINAHRLQDGWRSFPSGHSSFAFAGLGYLALIMAGQFSAFRPGSDLGRCLISFMPLLGAALIAISRLEDYRHDAFDVIAGSLLGLGVTYLSYRRYYRPLKHLKCATPYPSRTEMDLKRIKHRQRDEEQRLRDTTDFELADTVDERSES